VGNLYNGSGIFVQVNTLPSSMPVLILQHVDSVVFCDTHAVAVTIRCHCSIQQHVLPIHNCVSMNLQKNKITNTLLVILHGIVPHETQFIATCSQVTAITLLSSVADLTEDMTLRKHVIRVITGNTAKITVVCLCCLHCLHCSHSLV